MSDDDKRTELSYKISKIQPSGVVEEKHIEVMTLDSAEAERLMDKYLEEDQNGI